MENQESTPGENSAVKSEGEKVSPDSIMAVLAYIGPLVIVSYLVAKDEPFVKFHVKQGLVLFIIEMSVWFIGLVFYPLWGLINFINLAPFILSIIGIVNAVKGAEKILPVVGKYASYLKF